ncbi:hypothetical protein FA95DRAFT_1574772 [Auriscalpium vulgare]|uniref:Uncharacterized protein n=1 Tax=Auriscalpium vulgare TaxID=40419 RepID=A0ACB8RJM7_9AGAM|nr:hypothetical protein FA95DRAFT_1574772 [Auriscalpium vulgare]
MAAVRIHTTEPNSPLLLHALELWLAAPLRPRETYRRWEAASDPARPDRFLVVATAPVSPSGATTLPSTFVVEVALPMPPHLPGVWEACWMCAWHLVGTLSFLKNASCVGHPRPPAPAAAPIQLHVRQHLEEPGVSSDTAGGLFDTTWPFSLSTSISQANTDHGIMGPVLNVRGWPMQNREPLAAGYQGIMGPRSQSRPAGYHGIMCPQAKWVDGGFSSRY